MVFCIFLLTLISVDLTRTKPLRCSEESILASQSADFFSNVNKKMVWTQEQHTLVENDHLGDCRQQQSFSGLE